MEKRKFLRLRLKIRLSCSDLHYIFHILNSIGGPLGPMVQTSPSAQSDRSRTIKKIIKPVWTSSPEFGGGPSGALGGVIFQNEMSAANPQLVELLGPQLASQFSGSQASANIHLIEKLPGNQQVVVRKAYFEALRTIWIMVRWIFSSLSTFQVWEF